MSEMKWVPIWKFSDPDAVDAEFFLIHSDYVFDDKMEAQKCLYDFALCVLYRLDFVRVQEIDTKNIAHVKADLENNHGGKVPVAIIAGDIFKETGEKQWLKQSTLTSVWK